MNTQVDIHMVNSVLESFLEFLAEEMRQNPQQIQAIDSELANRIHALVANIEIDLDAPL